jgi:hypothetical protein
MELKRRFVFRGNAAAFGGRIVRPEDVILEASGASVLTVVGGRSTWSTKEVRFGDFVRLRSASTFAEGLFDDTKKAVALSHGKVLEETLTTSTVVRAEVKELVVGGKPQLKIRSIRGSLTAGSPAASYEPSIKLHTDTAIDGVSIDGFKLDVEIEHGVFQRYDTRAKLLTAADDPKFVKEYGRHLYMNTAAAGGQAPARGRLVRESGYILGTIVKQITWSGKPFPGAVIDENSVIVPDFGTIYFGEILINANARRLSMVRLNLGSPTGGSGVFVEVDTNGSWSN